MALQDAIAYALTLTRAVSGIKPALDVLPNYPPEQLSVFPFAVAYSGGGRWEFGPAGDKKGLHDIIVEVHIARIDLPRDVSAAMAYSDSVPNALMKNPTLGATCSTFGWIEYSFGPLGYGAVETIGFRFTLKEVKIQTAIT